MIFKYKLLLGGACPPGIKCFACSSAVPLQDLMRYPFFRQYKSVYTAYFCELVQFSSVQICFSSILLFYNFQSYLYQPMHFGILHLIVDGCQQMLHSPQ